MCVYELEREVNNGGLHQFFTNSPGQYARETIQALTAIGATSMASITREAVGLAFGDIPVPSDQDERAAVLDAGGEAMYEKLQELDGRFYEYPDNLTELLFAYVQENRESIRGAEPMEP